jgi:hypothetical protein
MCNNSLKEYVKLIISDFYAFEICFNKIEAACTNGSFFKTRNDIQCLEYRIKILRKIIAGLLPRIQNLITLSPHTEVIRIHHEF